MSRVEAARETSAGETSRASRQRLRIEEIPVARIRPEDGLGRKREREGHLELCRSIERFGVLTPITVRPAPGYEGYFLLIKGQGRTLACRQLGLPTVPALVVEASFAETEKVQQFLVENVARLRMRPIDRALLIAHARAAGEETVDVAKRFGISAATVRRLEAQLDGASLGEVAALRAGDVNMAVHAVIAKNVAPAERADIIRAIKGCGVGAREMETLLSAIGWRSLTELGDEHRAVRLRLLRWACETLATIPRGHPHVRLTELALRLPLRISADDAQAETL